MQLPSHVLKTLCFFILALFITGCVHHLDEQECQTLDLHQWGFNDGSKGLFQRTLDKERQDCSKFNISLNMNKYQSGWRAGTRQFCRADNGYELGINGQTYNNVCPNDLANSFRRSWRRGLRRYCVPDTGYNLARSGKPYPNFCAPDQVVAFRNAYQEGARLFRAELNAKVEVNNLNTEIHQKEKAIDRKRNDIKRWEADTRATDPNGRPLHKVRREAHEKIRNARWEIRQLRDDIDQLNYRRDKAQDRLARLSAE